MHLYFWVYKHVLEPMKIHSFLHS